MTKIILPCVLALYLASLGRTSAQDVASLSASIIPHKTELVVGEPLFLKLIITNGGAKAHTLYYSPDIGAAFISKDGKIFQRYSDGMKPRVRMDPVILKPTESITSYLTVLFSVCLEGEKKRSEYVFPESGVYFVQGGYEDGLGTQARSAAITITVKLPEGEDAKVWAKLRDMDGYGRIIQQPTQALDEKALAELAKIVDDHPTSLYSHYLALALGKNAYSRGKSAFPSALKYFELASKMAREPSLREEAMAHWVEMLVRDLGQNEKGAQAAEQALREFPDSRYKEQLQHWLKRARSRQ